MTRPEDFPDAEVAVMDLLERDFTQLAPLGDGQRRVNDETPDNLQALLVDEGWFVRVGLVTGSDDRFTDFSIVDVEVFAATRNVAYAAAEAIRTRLLGYPHRVGTENPVILDRVFTETKPASLPWEDDNVRRRGATYRISARR